MRGPAGTGGSPLPAGAVLPTLAGLVGKSLLTRADAQGGQGQEPRYRMLDTVRAYGLERLAEAHEDAATRDAAARYYLEFAETADPQLRTKAQAHWFRVADRRAGQRERRDPLGRRPPGRGHRAAVHPRPRLLLDAARPRRGRRALPRGPRHDPAAADPAARRGAGHLLAARGGLDLGHRPDQGAAHRGAGGPERLRRGLRVLSPAGRDGRAGAHAVRRRDRPGAAAVRAVRHRARPLAARGREGLPLRLRPVARQAGRRGG